MLPEQYTTYGWPANPGGFSIEFWDGRATDVVEPIYAQTTYSFGASPQVPGLLLVYPLAGTRRSRPYTFPVNDPASLSAIRWMVRTAVNDSSTVDGVDLTYPEAPKWPDREIDGYIREAIGLFNNYNRQEVIIESQVSLLRNDVLRRLSSISAVSYYDENVQEWIRLPRFVRRIAKGVPHYWDYVDGHLRLFGHLPLDPKLEIFGEAPYPTPMNDIDPILIERDDWDILSMYTQGRCYLRLAGQSAQLDRWKETGARNDNPIVPIARMLLSMAEQQMKDRHSARVVRRYRA